MGVTGLSDEDCQVRMAVHGIVRLAHNRDLARATRIAEISTLRLYCPLLNNNPPVT